MSNLYKIAVLIGRFEPTHNGHVANIFQALAIADKIHILIGSSFQPRTIKNPFTFAERKEMITNVLIDNKIDVNRCDISPLIDYTYNDNRWIQEVQDTVLKSGNISHNDIAILGHEKDESSWYLRAFPSWAFFPLRGFVEFGSRPIDATKIRELFFDGHLDYIRGAVPPSVFSFLTEFTRTDEYKLLVDEYSFIDEYKRAWDVAPYPPTFFTVDSVVVQGGHILLVKRKFAPGKGLWALPGGFVNKNETVRDACIRELREETGLKVPVPVLNGSITYEKLFDAPDRSLRGRTLTQAFLIELVGGDSKLPRVKGCDDASHAQWFTINEVLGMSAELFEDHYSIIQTMIGHAK